MCALFTANDASMRDFRLMGPAASVASNSEEENRHTLGQMFTVLKADIGVSTKLDLHGLLVKSRPA